ncbi:amidohydrolase [Clostridium omnivorum]|uniref:p-aminobenzoyl-glutamate hydrolase subunit A n=1 Tax=Clostridium omnivorum TaxID=1604902 RepID=A0ABQ5N4D0_9CLOT|nr:amidohydrolase [Clostridium sp. E14]GLC30058.1 p-aminobenzoyl-glutamate hydrolase subunit A [Clostridium sp. E14]
MDETINSLADNIESKIIEMRRDFHKYPELGFMEFRTASLIARRLIELGYEVKLGREVLKEAFRMDVPEEAILKENLKKALSYGADKKIAEEMKDGFTGVVASVGNGKGPIVALRFDIDALQINESEDISHKPYREGFSSIEKNVMHACGHDGHAAIGLGVAEILAQISERLKGTVKLIFQPAEEGVRGAKAMVEAGVLEDVDFLISGNIGINSRKSGELVCGTSGFLSTSKIDAEFIGKASHAAAAPEKGDNALLSAASAVMNLYSIPRNSEGETRINVGCLQAGVQRNVIPERAYMIIETRGETTALNEYMKSYAERILKASAEMHGTRVHIKYMGSSISAISDEEMAAIVENAAAHMGVYNKIHHEKVKFGASEDIAYMMERVQATGGKATYIMFGSDLMGEHHSSNFDFNEADLIKAVKLYSNVVYDILA